MGNRKTVTKARPPRREAAPSAPAPAKPQFEASQQQAQAQLVNTYGWEAVRVYNEMRAREATIMATLDAQHASYSDQATFFTHL